MSFNLFNIDSLNKQVLNSYAHLLNRASLAPTCNISLKVSFLWRAPSQLKISYSLSYLYYFLSTQKSKRKKKIHLGSKGLAFCITTCITYQGVCWAQSFIDRKCFINNFAVQPHLQVPGCLGFRIIQPVHAVRNQEAGNVSVMWFTGLKMS